MYELAQGKESGTKDMQHIVSPNCVMDKGLKKQDLEYKVKAEIQFFDEFYW
jgi:hypothetical protein